MSLSRIGNFTSARCWSQKSKRRGSLLTTIFFIFMVYNVVEEALEIIVNRLDDFQRAPFTGGMKSQQETTNRIILDPYKLNRYNQSLPPTSKTLELKRENQFLHHYYADDHFYLQQQQQQQNYEPGKSPRSTRWLCLIMRKLKRHISSFAIKRAQAIRLVKLDAPTNLQAGQVMRLKCIYETRGDKLQSLSWYKNGREFYRYQPFERRQPILTFNLTGVNVDMNNSRNNTIYLTNTTIETSGRYKCEATATNFQEVNMDTYVNVVAAGASSTIFLVTSNTWFLPFLLAVLIYFTNIPNF